MNTRYDEAFKWMIVLAYVVTGMLVALVHAATDGRQIEAGALLFMIVVSILFLIGAAEEMGERP